jgi:diadenosine tetraphosphate (Ap4A) HIT family hydrolase
MVALRTAERSRRPAWVSNAFVIAPTRGPLNNGHLLWLPREHITALGQVSDDARPEALAALRGVRDLVEARFGPTISFEHGTSGAPTAGGCGIDHAHVHFVPLTVQLDGLPPVPGASWKLLGQNWFDELRALSSQGIPYVYFEAPSGARYLTGARGLPSQYVRRWIAGRLGRAQWDWRASDPVVDFAAASEWMTEEIPPPGFSMIGELTEATI